jgi:hypothetical protein
LGDTHKAIDYYEQALGIAREIGDRSTKASASWQLGAELVKLGNLARAAELMQIYVDYLREIDHPDAEKRTISLDYLRQRLAASQDTVPAETPDEG